MDYPVEEYVWDVADTEPQDVSCSFSKITPANADSGDLPDIVLGIEIDGDHAGLGAFLKYLGSILGTFTLLHSYNNQLPHFNFCMLQGFLRRRR